MDAVKLSPEAAQARRDYMREWRRTHPDACRKHKANFWEKRAKAAQGKEAAGRE